MFVDFSIWFLSLVFFGFCLMNFEVLLLGTYRLGLSCLFDECPFFISSNTFVLKSNLSEINIVITVFLCFLLHGIFLPALLVCLYSECVSCRCHIYWVLFFFDPTRKCLPYNRSLVHWHLTKLSVRLNLNISSCYLCPVCPFSSFCSSLACFLPSLGLIEYI